MKWKWVSSQLVNHWWKRGWKALINATHEREEIERKDEWQPNPGNALHQLPTQSFSAKCLPAWRVFFNPFLLYLLIIENLQYVSVKIPPSFRFPGKSMIPASGHISCVLAIHSPQSTLSWVNSFRGMNAETKLEGQTFKSLTSYSQETPKGKRSVPCLPHFRKELVVFSCFSSIYCPNCLNYSRGFL